LAIEFAKLHGCGNDYIAIDGRALERDWGVLTAQMSRPAFGIGSDGIVLLQDSDLAQVRMRVFNPDGSEAEMSGNGIRLFAKFVLDRGIAVPEDGGLTVETLGGVRTVWPEMVDGRMKSARVAMGPATFAAREVPVETSGLSDADEIISEKVEIGGTELSMTCLAIGNPHAVAIMNDPVEDFPLAEVGRLVENHAMFPQRINFEVVNVHARDRIRARIFERGAGETLSSGTGSTASAFACRKLGLVDDAVEVVVDGGVLRVSWDENDEAFLEGPAVEVFNGVWNE
jgi:diaminopimelate epimerase